MLFIMLYLTICLCINEILEIKNSIANYIQNCMKRQSLQFCHSLDHDISLKGKFYRETLTGTE